MNKKITIAEFLGGRPTKKKKNTRYVDPWPEWAIEALESLVRVRGAQAVQRKLYRDYISPIAQEK